MTHSSLNLTIVATVFLPLTFITGSLGMNVAGIPDQHNPYGFWLVTGLSVIISLLAWLLLRRQVYDRYLDKASTDKKKPGRLPETSLSDGAGLTSTIKASRREHDKRCDPPPDTEGGHQDKSDEAKVDRHRPCSWSKIAGVHVFALLLALVLFAFHVFVIFDASGEMVRHKAWLLAHLGPENYGKIILLGCFLLLTLAHLAEAAAWGLFLRRTRLIPSLYGRHLFHRRDDHDSGLRRHPAEVSLATSRDIDCDNGGADVRLFNGVLVRDLAGRLGASLFLESTEEITVFNLYSKFDYPPPYGGGLPSS